MFNGCSRSRPVQRANDVIGRLFDPIDGSTLAVFRICFGVVIIYEAYRIWGKLDSEYLATRCPIRYEFFDWMATPSRPVFQSILVMLAAAGAPNIHPHAVSDHSHRGAECVWRRPHHTGTRGGNHLGKG